MVYPALLPLLPLMRTPRLPAVEWTDAPADLNGLVRFAERRNPVSARVPSHFKRSLPTNVRYVKDQNSEDLNYTAAEACIHTRKLIFMLKRLSSKLYCNFIQPK